MTPADLGLLFDYSNWATHRVLAGAAKVTAKQLGAAKITGTYALVARSVGKGKKKKAAPGYEIVVYAGTAAGFSAVNWNELPAEDMQPILLPWEGKKQTSWRFRGDEAFGGE